MKTMPTRVDGELFEAAKAVGDVQSRSAAQQIDHWARIGRELEASSAVTHEAINRVLAGEGSYDDLSDPAQAIVRVAWHDEIASRIAGLSFENDLNAVGEPWAEADADGHLVLRGGGAGAA
ncbi:MAG: hypothetical protein JWQ19_302 [Subtercola sp.]|nr:hypothetical protein [Subtercola sp.]